MSTEITSDSEQSDCIDKFLRAIGVGRRPINDPFFEESHKACKVFRRTGVTVEDDEDLCHDVMKEFPCCVFGCKARFHNLIDFEIHYNGSHRYVCQECKKIRPNARLLEIHIQETHDSYFRVLAEKQPVNQILYRERPVLQRFNSNDDWFEPIYNCTLSQYQCYVTECDAKFANPEDRHNHCTTVHKFPAHFRYDCVRKKKEKAQSDEAMDVEQDKAPRPKPKKTRILLNKNQKIKTFGRDVVHQPSDVPKPAEESEMECSTTKSSAESQTSDDKKASVAKSILAFLPRQVANKSYAKILTNNETMERNVLETETLMDLAQALPE